MFKESLKLNLPKKVKILEVGPRDGLQNERLWVSTFDKINFIEELVRCGLKHIEITAFVSPKWIPPLADHMEVALGIKKDQSVTYMALVPNIMGYERALKAKIDEVSLVISLTESHNQKNLNASTNDVFLRYKEVSKQALKDKIPFRIYLSCAFGCPYEGTPNLSSVYDMTKKLLDLGAYEVALSDTIGVGVPTQTISMLELLLSSIDAKNLALHFHDTKGLALANIFSALILGISSFDSSLGGLGGCPYAKGASGNVSSEDLVNMLNGLNIEHGIDLGKMLNLSLQMEQILQKNLPSRLLSIKRAEK